MSAREIFYSIDNKRIISDIICNVSKRDFNISIGAEFAETMVQIMNSVFKHHVKPESMNDTEHIKNLNTLTISECLKHIKAKLNINRSNHSNSLSHNNNMSSYQDAFRGGLIPHPNGMIPQLHMQQQPQMQMQQPQMQMQQMPYGYDQQQQMSQLPFQQIDPRSDVAMSPDVLLAQKMHDRNQLNYAIGGRPTVGGPNLPNYNILHAATQQQQMDKFLQSQENIQPGVIQQFMALGPAVQAQLAQTQPAFYQRIMATIHKMTTVTTKKDKNKHGKSGKKQDKDDSSSSSDHESGANADSEDSVSSADESGLESDTDSPAEQRSKTRTEARSTRISRTERGERNEKMMEPPSVQKHQFRAPKSNCGRSEFLSLDFRKDLRDVENNKYALIFNDLHNVEKIELHSCIINQHNLEGEPYIYILIDEIPSLFGKLILDKSVNGFFSYTPENCEVEFDTPVTFNKFTVSFAKYDRERVSLNKITIKKLSKCSNSIKLMSTSCHTLSVGDRINIYNLTNPDEITVNNLRVVETPDPNTFVTETPSFVIDKNPDLLFEKLDIKCTLTFKVFRRYK